jgi:hypothetical protein
MVLPAATWRATRVVLARITEYLTGKPILAHSAVYAGATMFAVVALSVWWYLIFHILAAIGVQL